MKKEENKKQEEEKIVIDAKNAIVGRMASFVAKEALRGKTIAVINCEKSVITGRKEDILKKQIKRRQLGGSAQRGPNFSKVPDKIVKRIIRGMLPYKKAKGREAFKRIKCYKGVPEEFEKVKKIIAKEKNKDLITIEKISNNLK